MPDPTAMKLLRGLSVNVMQRERKQKVLENKWSIYHYHSSGKWWCNQRNYRKDSIWKCHCKRWREISSCSYNSQYGRSEERKSIRSLQFSLIWFPSMLLKLESSQDIGWLLYSSADLRITVDWRKKQLSKLQRKMEILGKIWPEPCMEYIVITPAQSWLLRCRQQTAMVLSRYSYQDTGYCLLKRDYSTGRLCCPGFFVWSEISSCSTTNRLTERTKQKIWPFIREKFYGAVSDEMELHSSMKTPSERSRL